MPAPRHVHFYLEDALRASASAGNHNFINIVLRVLAASGFETSYHANTPAARMRGAVRHGYALCHMTPPPHERALTFRRAYHYPFWQIQASDKRWEWDVALAPFDAAACPRQEADRFHGYWRKRVCGDLLNDVSDEGFIYMPLQGRLEEHRSFQTCSPLDMIALTRRACPDRRIIATLHPKETYQPGELAALSDIGARDPLFSVRTGGRDALLPRCSFVVTQTSSVAFDAMFFGKAAVAFGQTDFHHIMLAGQEPGAFDRVANHRPDFAAYVWWFWQHMAINAGHPEAEGKIKGRLAAAGWPVG